MTIQNTDVGNVAQLPNGGAENMGIAPTTPSTVDDNQIPQSSVTTTPTSGAPNAPAPQPGKTIVQPNYVQPTKPHPMSRVYDGILKNLSGGPITVTDPVSGERREVPQTRGTMAKSILASVLAGLMSPTVRNPDGTLDSSSTMGGAAAAAMKFQDERKEKAQELTNAQQAAKLMTMQNNAKLVQLQAASAHAKHVMLAEQNENAQQFMGPLQEYDKLRTSANDPSQPPAFSARNLSADDVLNGGHKLTDSNIIMDGTRQVYNQDTKQMEEEPTYAVLNPALKDIKLTPEVTNKLNEINSQWKDIHQVVGGDVRIPINAYVSAMHDYQAVTAGQNTLDTLAKEVGGKSFNVSQAVRANNKLLAPLYQLTQAVAGGNTVDKRPDNLLDTLLKTPNGGELLQAMGITPEAADKKIQSIQNERTAAQTIAKEGATADKAPAPESEVNALIAAAKALPPKYRDPIIAGVNPKGMTNGQAKSMRDKLVTATHDAATEEEAKLKDGGDPVLNQKVASNIVEGDVSRITNLPVRGQAREAVMSLIHDEAQRRGLDTTRFSPAALENKSNTYNDYWGNKRGSTGAQITSFNAFMGHIGGALTAAKALDNTLLGPTGIPVVNTAMDKLGKEVLDSPQWKAYKTSLLPVQQEISNFLAAGYATKSEDSALMNQILDPHETPGRINAALRQLAETGDIRLKNMGQTYLDTMGTTFPNLVKADTANTLKALGINSQAAKVSVKIPMGWQNGQAQPLPKEYVKTFMDAAGGNPTVATDLARQNGWK